MISKTINYIWLGSKQMPKLNKLCIDSWKSTLPNYKIKCWELKDFEISKMPYVKSALESKNFAFAADFLRSWILYNKGGLYFDTDVYVLKNFDEFMNDKFFSFIEVHHDSIVPVIQAAAVGCEAGHPIAKSFCDYFCNHSFTEPSKSKNKVNLCPDIYAQCAKNFGFKEIDTTQQLAEDATIYNSTYFAGAIHEYKETNFGIHCCAGSWRKRSAIEKYIINNKQLQFIKTLNKKQKITN